MTRRRSKWERRKIASLIEKRLQQQPGYEELVLEQKRIKSNLYSAEFDLKKDYYNKKVAILTNTPLSAAAFHVLRTRSFIIDFWDDHPLILTTAALVALILSISFISFATCMVLAISTLLISWKLQEAKISKESVPLSAISDEYERKLNEIRASSLAAIRISNEIFSGYPVDWSSRRDLVLRRDNNSCQLCGKSAKATTLHIHHIDEISMGGSNHLDNLLALCASCHTKEHSSRK